MFPGSPTQLQCSRSEASVGAWERGYIFPQSRSPFEPPSGLSPRRMQHGCRLTRDQEGPMYGVRVRRLFRRSKYDEVYELQPCSRQTSQPFFRTIWLSGFFNSGYDIKVHVSEALPKAIQHESRT